ncbi:MAG: amidase [Filomicrobium sp.]
MSTDIHNAYVSEFELRGADDGPLAGTTFALKDLYDIEGMVTGAGNPDWLRTHAPARSHAVIVETLLAAGATCFGKTHTDELAYSLMGANAHYGTPRNPAAPERVPGGSSSGSAVATAAGLVDFAIGTDTGGSVRLPASFCGIFGLRPTHDCLSLSGVVPLAPSFDVVGWFARDMATIMRVADALGIASEPVGPEGFETLLLPADMWALAEPGTRDALASGVDRIAREVASTNDAEVNQQGFDEWREVFRICQGAEIWSTHGEWITAHEPRFGQGVRERFEAASRITADETEKASSQRKIIAGQLNDLLADAVVLAFPTAPASAPLRTADGDAVDKFRMHALELLCSAGLAGLPQLSVPCGNVGGAPVGLSLMSARGSDRRLLEFATRVFGAQ